MKPFDLELALKQGYCYTRDKHKVLDLKLSNLNVNYPLTGRLESSPELVKTWTKQGYPTLEFIRHPLDLCYLEVETVVSIETSQKLMTRSIDLEHLCSALKIPIDDDYKNCLITISFA